MSSRAPSLKSPLWSPPARLPCRQNCFFQTLHSFRPLSFSRSENSPNKTSTLIYLVGWSKKIVSHVPSHHPLSHKSFSRTHLTMETPSPLSKVNSAKPLLRNSARKSSSLLLDTEDLLGFLDRCSGSVSHVCTYWEISHWVGPCTKPSVRQI